MSYHITMKNTTLVIVATTMNVVNSILRSKILAVATAVVCILTIVNILRKNKE